MTNATTNTIRTAIRPFPRVATYPTGWAGDLTFEQISDHVAPKVAAHNLAHSMVYERMTAIKHRLQRELKD